MSNMQRWTDRVGFEAGVDVMNVFGTGVDSRFALLVVAMWSSTRSEDGLQDDGSSDYAD